MSTYLAFKVDVDTHVGTREGVPRLIRFFKEHDIPATFYFSLGPDNTGKAIYRIFRPGFFKKVWRTNVGRMYGVRTLLSGTVLPAPLIGKENESILRETKAAGFEVGIHCYDHVYWQDHVHRLSLDKIAEEFDRAIHEFARIFDEPSKTAAAPGWQANAKSFEAYDHADFLYGSDCRGVMPFYPRTQLQSFRTLQIPTTLPTFDELLGRKEYAERIISKHYMSLLRSDFRNVMTIHAEIEGMSQFPLFERLVLQAKDKGVTFFSLGDWAKQLQEHSDAIPFALVEQGEVDGRSGKLACQAEFV